MAGRGTLTMADLGRKEGVEGSLEGQPGEEEAGGIRREARDLTEQKGLDGSEGIGAVVDLKSRRRHGTLVSVAGDVGVHNPNGGHHQNAEGDQDGAKRDI